MAQVAGKIWFDGKLIAPEEAKFDVMSHALHYGSGVFEGTRFYQTDKGPAIFRLPDHTKRLFYSADCLKLPINFSQEEVNQATQEIVKQSGEQSGYIRPLAWFGEGKMGLRPEGATPHLMICCWPWGKYLPDRAIKVKISKYIRIHPDSLVADAKVTGHYVNSILAVQEVIPQGYDEALLLDYQGNVAEGPGENFFLVKDGVIYTPPLGTILAGITRNTIISLAQDLGIEVKEKTIKPEEIWQADEAFFTGTAAEVTPIGSVNDKIIGDGKQGEITQKLRQLYMDIVHGRAEQYQHFLTFC